MHRVHRQSFSTTNVGLLLLKRTFLGVGGESGGGVTDCMMRKDVNILHIAHRDITSAYAPILKS